MSVKGLEMLRKHMSYYDFNPDRVLLLGNVLYYAKKAEVEVAELEAENAKLRELVRDYEHCSMHADCDKCEYDGRMSTHCPLSPCFPDIYELNELGVEVDG